MDKKGFTLVEVIAVVALLAILIGLAGTSFVKKYNESKKEAIIIQEGQLVQSGDMVVQDYCKNPLNEGYQLQCDKYFQPYEDNNNNLIIEDNTYTKYICVKDLKDLNYYSEELVYSGVQCSGVVVYKIDYETDMQKESYSVIKCGEDYITEVDNAQEYITNFKECFDTEDSGGQTEEVRKYLLTVNFTELTPSGMKVATSHSQEYQKGQSISLDVPEYTTAANEYTPFKHGSSQNANNFSLNTERTKLIGTMPEGNVVVNIVYSASTYILTVNYKEFNDVQGNINFPSKQYTLYYGESVEIPYENVTNFKIISPNSFTFQMEQEDVDIDVIYQQQEFNLTYNSNGGSACGSKRVTYNKAYGTLCTPTRTGYKFTGWKLSNGSSVTASTINTNYRNVTLTANWEANKYYVIYNCNGGTPTSSYSSEHTYDVTQNLTANRCVKTGSVFTGWLDTNNNTYTNQQSVRNLKSNNGDSITLTAQWTPLTYYVAFAANGGSGSMSKMTLRYGQVVNLSANTFTRTGHRFDGWTGSNGVSYADKASITNLITTHGATITMSARWTRCGNGTYLVNNVCTSCPVGTYSTGGVNSCTPCSAGTYTSSTGSSSCTTCTAGYYCPGGSDRKICAAGTYTSTSGKSSCTTCAAGTYNTSSGSTGCSTCTAGYYCTGGTNRIMCPAGTYRTSTGGTSSSSCSTCTAGYYCTGGTNRVVCPAGTYRTSTGGTSLSSCSSCPIGYYCTGGTNKLACAAGTYTSSTGKSSCTTCEAGYYCPGASNRIACPTGHTSNSGASVCTKINYTVTISRNNTSYGTVSASTVSIPYGTTYTASGNKITFSNGTTVTATATTLTGYTTTFSGWSSTSGTITGAATITANFTRTPIKYTFTTAVNNSNYGTVTGSVTVNYGTTYTSSGAKITFSDGQTITGTVKNATGYTTTFSSWSSDSGTVTGDKTITANFARRGNNYSVIYNCNGGTPTNAYSSNHVYGTASNLTDNKCSKAGYDFAGWIDTSGTTYTNKQSVSTLVTTDGGTITFNAQWTAKKYTITFNANGGSVSTSSIVATYGTSYGTLPTPTRSGYKFIGWYTGTATRDSSKAYKDYPWLYYSDYYSDLYNAFGYNETSLANHYKNNGKSEGRRISQYISSDVFNGTSNLTIYAGWEKCSAGTYSNTANNSCDVCSAGTYSAAGAGSCTTCAAGTFNTGTGNSTCSSCTAGYYCTGGTAKVACAAGKWSDAGSKASSACYDCPAGSYCPGNGVKNLCAINTFSLLGQTACTACYTGYENYGTGFTQCFPKTYTITFNGNGGSVSTTSKTVTYNSEIGDLPVPTRDGYKFFGWFDGTTTAQDDSTKLYKDHPMLHYSDYNFDLKDAFGYDEAALLDHYLTYGVNEPARYIGQYRSKDTWKSNQNITLYAGWYTEAISVTINAGVYESVTCTHPSDSSKSFTVTTSSTGSASASITAGTYTCTGAMSGYSKEVGFTTNGQSVNIYPDGAIYWYGNGDSPSDSLYAVSGGFSSMAYKANGYSVGDSALRNWYLQHYDNYMYYYSDCTQYQNGYGGTLFNNSAFSMTGYSQLKTYLSVSRCRSSSCTAYSGAGSANEVGLYLPTSKVNNYDNSPSNKWTGTISNATQGVGATGNRYFALQLKSGYYWDSYSSSSSCSKTMITIKAIYRE